MKNLLVILLTGFTLNGFAQFTDKQITLLTKINCGLTEAWVVGEIGEEQESLGEGEDAEEITVLEFEIYHHKTYVHGETGSVLVYLFPKSKAKEVKAENWNGEDRATDFIETKSFIVVIQYYQEWNDYYDAAMPVLLPEIKAWFKVNTESF